MMGANSETQLSENQLSDEQSRSVAAIVREELARLPQDQPDASSVAIRRTMVTAGRTVLFSGLTVAAAMSSLLIFPQAFLRSMGYGGIAAVVIAMLAALTILPAVLRLLGWAG